MKRSVLFRCICLLMALIMCLSLCACGSKPASDEKGSSSADVKVSAEPTGFAYSSDYKTIFEAKEGDTLRSLYLRHYTPDGIYATSWEVIGENNPEGKAPQWEGEFDIYGTFVYLLRFDGKLEKLENYQPLTPIENENNAQAFSAGTNLESIAFSETGFTTIEVLYASWYNGERENVSLYSDEYYENQKYIQRYFIRSFDLEGNELSCSEIGVDENDYFNTYNMKLDSKGNALVSVGNRICAIAADGSFAYTIEIDSDSWIDSFVRFADGSIGVIAYGGKQKLYKLDETAAALDDGTEISFNAYQTAAGSGEYDLYVTMGTNFCGYKLEENRLDTLFNWVSCNVNADSASVLSVRDDGTVILSSERWNNVSNSYKVELIGINKVPADSVAQKTSITLAYVNYLDGNIMDAIVAFNRSNDKYRIDIQDYSQYNNEQDGWDAGMLKLNTEILSGNIPDIICLQGLNYKNLASKGILEDLYPYIDSDKELNRKDFFSNVLDAFSVDGKLCTTVSGFYVTSVLGASSVVGDTPGWSYDEFNAALASMPEGCSAFDEYTTKTSILSDCLALDMDLFVNWGTGECNFASDEFKKLLAFANTFPDEYDWENYEYSGESVTDRLSQGKQMLVQTSAFSVEDIFYNGYTQFLGGSMTFVGYPTQSGTGNMMNIDNVSFGMSSKSEHKDAVWSFLRGFFSKEYQKYYIYSFSSRLDVFEEKVKEACTVQYEKDKDGNYRLDENGEKIPISRYSMWGADNKEHKIYAIEKEQADQIRDLITSTSKVADYNDSIYKIVVEQAEAYFQGQKSLDDVARLIQSKANIYVNEQR